MYSDIIQMYCDTSACVSMELGPTEWFNTTSGVLQGDVLSPYLFIVLLDCALKKTLQDDVGFVICGANGDPVDSCDKFEFLGVPSSNAETVLQSHLSKAWAVASKLCSIFNSKANDALKIGLCKSAGESILLYGLECLPLTLTLQDKLDEAYRRILRNAPGVYFSDRISNTELTRWTGATALSKTLRQWGLRLVGCALGMANHLPLMIILRFLQPGHLRRCGHARSLSLHQNSIDDISEIIQSVISITSSTKSCFNQIVATLDI